MDREGDKPIRKEVVTARDPDEAFRRFTAGMGDWWPLAAHSVAGGVSGGGVTFDERAIVERAADGAEHVWGRVQVWEPPERLVFTWHPGRDPATAQEIEVRFEPHAAGSRVTLEHRGWERYGEGAAAMHARYETGWDGVFVEGFGAS